MHKLIEYACEELEQLEKKVAKSDNLSAAEIEYAAKLASMKKDLLKGEKLYEEMDEYSNAMGGGSYTRGGSYARGRQTTTQGGGSYEGGSYARGRGRNARRDSMGRYASEGGYSRNDEMIAELRELMQDAPDEQTRQEFQRFIQKMEMM